MTHGVMKGLARILAVAVAAAVCAVADAEGFSSVEGDVRTTFVCKIG